MTARVTLNVSTVPHEDGNKVIGQVRRGNEILHTKEVITDDSIHSVGSVQDDVALDIELWAVENTEYMPA